MNQGVEILLARMDSNPDEFVGDVYASSDKWDWFLTQLGYRVNPTPEIKKEGYVALGFLNDAEIKALWEKLESLRADQFTKKVMSTLLKEEDGVSLYGIGHKPSKILTTAALKDQALKLLESEIPKIDLNEAALEQIMLDLNTYEKAKKRGKK